MLSSILSPKWFTDIFHLMGLADYVKQGIYEAGGIPREFNTIAVCDGICQGHKCMKYSLMSREIIADFIECIIEAHQFDAMVMMPGRYKDMTLTLTDMRELIGRTQTGKMSLQELMEAEQSALPGVETCSMLGTANTMSRFAEILGMSLPGCGLAHAVSSKKARIAKQSGKRIVKMIKENLTPRKIMTCKCLRNAISAGMAMGASTNSTLHIPAIAHEANLDVTLEDFDELAEKFLIFAT